MIATSNFTRKNLSRELAACGQWPCPSISHLEEDEQRAFTTHKQLIEDYLVGIQVASRLQMEGVSHSELLRKLNRCVSFTEAGVLVGWSGLLPGMRIKKYERRAPVVRRSFLARGGYAGALHSLFAAHPDIQDRLDSYILTGRREGAVPESRVTRRAAHAYFIALCEEKELSSDTWPFSVNRRGICSIRKYFLRFCDAHYDEIVIAQYGKRAQAKSNTGTGYASRVKATLPFDVVELDEHSAHFLGAIGIPTPGKGLKWVPISRVQIILLVDRFSRAVLAYTVVYRRAATTHDILRTVALALRSWVPRRMTLRGFEVCAGDGFPSNQILELASCGFSRMLIDNALIHLAEPVTDRISTAIGCAINFGPPGRFERRPIVEHVFKALEEAGFTRLPSTTGSNDQDPLRHDAELAATTFRMSVEAVDDLIEAVIARYNNERTGGNFGSSPLEQLRNTISNEQLGFLPPAPPLALPHEPTLDLVIEHARIGGNREKGVRPHIYLDSVKYTCPELASRWDLLKQSVELHIDEDDIQTVTAYLETGVSLGTLHALGNWGDAPHSREARRQINALLDSGELAIERGKSPVVTWLALLQEQAVQQAGSSSKKPKVSVAATMLAAEQHRGNVVQSPTTNTAKPEEAVDDSSGSHAASTAAKRQRLEPTLNFKAIN